MFLVLWPHQHIGHCIYLRAQDRGLRVSNCKRQQPFLRVSIKPRQSSATLPGPEVGQAAGDAGGARWVNVTPL